MALTLSSTRTRWWTCVGRNRGARLLCFIMSMIKLPLLEKQNNLWNFDINPRTCVWISEQVSKIPADTDALNTCTNSLWPELRFCHHPRVEGDHFTQLGDSSCLLRLETMSWSQRDAQWSNTSQQNSPTLCILLSHPILNTIEPLSIVKRRLQSCLHNAE